MAGRRKTKIVDGKAERAAATLARRMRFAREYLKDRNGRAAAERAGYAKVSAKVTASLLLKVPAIAAYIAEHGEKQAAKLEVTAERVLAEIARVAFSDIRQCFTETGALKDVGELSDDAARTISSVDVRRVERRGKRGEDDPPEEIVKLKLWDKLRALEALAKHTGVLKEPPAQAGTVNWQVDPERLAKMSEAEIADAVRIGKLLTGAV